MSQNILNVWLHGEPVGELEQLRNGRTRLRFSAESRARWGDGTRLLSYALPLGPKRVEGELLDAYLENLLPEGSIRVQLERQYRVRPGNSFDLLRHIGHECAGAVQFSVEDEPSRGYLKHLTELEASALVERLPTLAAPEGEAVSASLGGVQSKILLTRTSDGWAWPAAGAMSTHIIKPEPIEFSAPIARIVEYEHWALTLARAAGIPAAKSSLEMFGSRLAIVVERYDRTDTGRLHQEDFAQALAIRPGDKYERLHEAPGRLSRIAHGPGRESINPAVFMDDMLTLVTFNALIGNGDAHAKNYSMLLSDGLFGIAPAYDVAPVFYVSQRFGDFGMSVDGQRGLQHISVTHLLREAEAWGMPAGQAQARIEDVSHRVLSALGSVETQDFILPIAEKVERAASR